LFNHVKFLFNVSQNPSSKTRVQKETLLFHRNCRLPGTRDGKFIQKLGTYNPLTVPATIQLDRQKALEWLSKGATPTDTVRRILSFKGVLFLKHLLRGVKLGLFDDAAAMEKFTKWTAEHDAQLKKRQEDAYRNKRSRRPMPGRRPERKTEGEGGGEG